MRILNLLPRIATPPVDGGAIGVYYPMRHLSDLGHDLCTLSLVSNRHPQDTEATRAYSELYTVPGNFPDFGVLSALRNIFDRRPYNLALRFARPEMHQLIYKVARETPKPDIIQIDWVYMGEYIPTLRKAFPKIPIVLRQHNAEYVIFERLSQNEKNLLKKTFLAYQAFKVKRYERRILKKADFYTTVTATDEMLFRRLAPAARGKTIPAGVETQALQRPPNTPRDSGFLILGSLSWAPYAQAVQWFLENVWTGFIKTHPGTSLYIVGSAPPAHIQRWSGTMGIHVTGFVEDVKPLMHRASAMVVPLLSGSGMRIKIVEAMAASLPVITTTIGVEGIEAEHRKHVLVADSPNQLCAAMRDLLNNPFLGDRLADEGLKLVREKYEWKAIAQEFERVYTELIEASAPK